MTNQFDQDRPAVAAGIFYPEDPVELKHQIDFSLQNLEENPIVGEIRGMIVPHAGYMYSGQVAAAAYKQILDREYNVVVVISPSHREYFNGVSVLPARTYKTPLGNVKINRELTARLAEFSDFIHVSWNGHRGEHALEVQLPFLQRTLGDFELVPIVMGDQIYDYGYELGEVVAKLVRHENALIVASSDLSHYYPAGEAEKMDKRIIKRVNAFDYDGLWDEIEAKNSEACGAGPMLACMVAAKKIGANKSEVLLYQHSGNVTGDHSEVVGYLSAVLYQV
ncbi:MAG TPA: AmmeMemoRadiSam system protein B [Bacteroidetes bacterium]|nr:AmmeMemoRadiSam system protein B [Bacteroidota bacterium]